MTQTIDEKVRDVGYACVTAEERDAVLASTAGLLHTQAELAPGKPFVVFTPVAAQLVITRLRSRLGELELETRKLMQALPYLEQVKDGASDV